MEFTLYVADEQGNRKAATHGTDRAILVYSGEYAPGDSICLEGSEPGFVVAQLDDSIAPTFGWLSAPYALHVPFGEQKVSYSPKNFSGGIHLLTARVATSAEIAERKNLAFNPLDAHENSGLFPHAYANVETRGEAVFAARNAINGNYANSSHGEWPYESWGINQNPDAEITIDFGRDVVVDEVVITLRADFPHDNWWHQATIAFSDGSTEQLRLEKSDQPQAFPIASRTVQSASMREMKKDETDPSPFPALTQIEFWGVEKGL